MRQPQLTVPMRELASHVTMTVKVTGQRRYQVRWWIASRLIRLAALVAGIGIEIEAD
jgi:hypothetical protein